MQTFIKFMNTLRPGEIMSAKIDGLTVGSATSIVEADCPMNLTATNIEADKLSSHAFDLTNGSHISLSNAKFGTIDGSVINVRTIEEWADQVQLREMIKSLKPKEVIQLLDALNGLSLAPSNDDKKSVIASIAPVLAGYTASLISVGADASTLYFFFHQMITSFFS